MKKFLIAAALAVGVAALSLQPASAWIKFNFSAGINWTWESGNNSFLWGLWTSGQAPGWPTDVGCLPGCGPSPYAAGFGGLPGWYGDTHGMAPYYGAGDHGSGYVAPQPTPANPPADKGKDAGNGQASSWYGNSAYQPASYHQAPSYYQAPAAYYPSYNYYGGYSGYGSYGYSQVPSYWYGNN